MTEEYIPSNRMSSEDKTLEPSDQGPSPAPASSTAATPAGSPAIADKRPRGRPRKDGVAPIHKSKKKEATRPVVPEDNTDVNGSTADPQAPYQPQGSEPLVTVGNDIAWIRTCALQAIGEQLCAFCNCGERSLLGQGELKQFSPSPGYTMPRRSQCRTKRDSTGSNEGEGNSRPKLNSTARRQRGQKKDASPRSAVVSVVTVNTPYPCDEPASKFWDELSQVGLPEDTDLQSLSDPSDASPRSAVVSVVTVNTPYPCDEPASKFWDELSQHCAYCKRLGATIKCCEEKCSRLYHYPCAAAAGTFQDIRSHTLLCPEHIEQATGRLKDEVNCALCDSPGDLLDQLFCSSCGQHYHGMCLDIGVTPLKRAGWQCPDCKVCQTCKWIHLDCDRQAENETSVLLKDGYVCTICKQVEVEELQASQTCEVLETAEPVEEPEPACLEQEAVEEPGSLDHAAEENRLNEEQKPVETETEKAAKQEALEEVETAAAAAITEGEPERELQPQNSEVPAEVVPPSPEEAGTETEAGEVEPMEVSAPEPTETQKGQDTAVQEKKPLETPVLAQEHPAPELIENHEVAQVSDSSLLVEMDTTPASEPSFSDMNSPSEDPTAEIQQSPERSFSGSMDTSKLAEPPVSVGTPPKDVAQVQAAPASSGGVPSTTFIPGAPKIGMGKPAITKRTFSPGRPRVRQPPEEAGTETEAGEVEPMEVSAPEPTQTQEGQDTAVQEKKPLETPVLAQEHPAPELIENHEVAQVSDSSLLVEMDTTPASEPSFSDMNSPSEDPTAEIQQSPERSFSGSMDTSKLAEPPVSVGTPPKDVAQVQAAPASSGGVPSTTFIPGAPKIGMGKPAITKRTFSPGRPRVRQTLAPMYLCAGMSSDPTRVRKLLCLPRLPPNQSWVRLSSPIDGCALLLSLRLLSEDVLNTLTGAMSLLRRCRVNAALTIQLFSQLFHFINMWLFNKLVTEPDSELCSHYWGAILRQQLGHIEAWAEKQGLELAADCHLSRIVQATTLLTMDKYSMQDIPNINNTCFKLNSLQLQALLQNYHCAPDEPYIPPVKQHGTGKEGNFGVSSTLNMPGSVAAGVTSEAQNNMHISQGDTEEKLRQRLRLREIILRQQQQKIAVRQEKVLQDPALSAAPGTPRHWSQEDPNRPNEPFSRPPPPYPGTLRGPLIAPGAQRFPGPFPNDPRGSFPRDRLFNRPLCTGDVTRMGMRPRYDSVDKIFLSPSHQMQGSVSGFPQQLRRSLSVDLPRPMGSSQMNNPIGLHQHFPPRGMQMQQHNIMGQPFIELRHRAPESRLRLQFGPSLMAQENVMDPSSQRTGGFMTGQEMGFSGNQGSRLMEPMMNQHPGMISHMQMSTSFEHIPLNQMQMHTGHPHAPLMRSLSHPVTSETFSVAPLDYFPSTSAESTEEIPLASQDVIAEKLDPDDSAVKDLDDVEVKDLDDEDLENLNLDPEDGKGDDLDLETNDLHLDDFLRSGKFDIIAYTDPELDLGDKKDMFNEELDLSDPIEDHPEAVEEQKTESKDVNTNSVDVSPKKEATSGMKFKLEKTPERLQHVKQESSNSNENTDPSSSEHILKTEAHAHAHPPTDKDQSEERNTRSQENTGGSPSLSEASAPSSTGTLAGSTPALPSLLIKDKVDNTELGPLGPPTQSMSPAHQNHLTGMPQNPNVLMTPGQMQEHAANPNLSIDEIMDHTFSQGAPPPVNPNFIQGQDFSAEQQIGTHIPMVDQSEPSGMSATEQALISQALSQQNRERPLLLDEQPLLLQDLLDQERQEQQQQRQMQAMIRQRSSDSFFPNIDFDAITDPIMKAKMVALKGINKVMVQNSMGMPSVVMNRFQFVGQQMPEPEVGEGVSVPQQAIGPDGKLAPQMARPNPPSFDPGFVNDAQKKQYEEWLQDTQQLLQMQQKFLEEQIGVHRKSKKALSAKQRTAKKAGREFPEDDAEQLKHVTEQQSVVQKQLEQKKQYEEWLQDTQQLLQMQQKFLEEQIGVHRKSKKALSAKQRTAKKAGREFPEDDAEQLKHVTEQQSVTKTQLEQIRKQQKEHAELIEEYRIKQQQQGTGSPALIQGVQSQPPMVPRGPPPVMTQQNFPILPQQMEQHLSPIPGQPTPPRMPGVPGWHPGAPAPMAGLRMQSQLPPHIPVNPAPPEQAPLPGENAPQAVAAAEASTAGNGAHVKFDDNNPFSEGFQERERKERLREQQERQRIQLMQEVERQRTLQQRLELEQQQQQQQGIVGPEMSRASLSQMPYFNSELPHDFMQRLQQQQQQLPTQQQMGQMFPQQQSMQQGFISPSPGTPFAQGNERRHIMGNGPFGPPDMPVGGPNFQPSNQGIQGANFVQGQPRPPAFMPVMSHGTGEGPPFAMEPVTPLPPSYPGSGQSLIQLYSNIIPEEKGKKKRNRKKKKKEDDADSVKAPSTPHSDLATPLTPCVSDTASTPTRIMASDSLTYNKGEPETAEFLAGSSTPRSGVSQPPTELERQLSASSSNGNTTHQQALGRQSSVSSETDQQEEPAKLLHEIKLEQMEATECRGPRESKVEVSEIVKLEGKEGTPPYPADHSPAHGVSGTGGKLESGNELLKHLLKNKNTPSLLPQQRSEEEEEEEEGAAQSTLLQKQNYTEGAVPTADNKMQGNLNQEVPRLQHADREQDKKKQRNKRAPKSGEKPAPRPKKRKKDENDRHVPYPNTDSLMSQLKQNRLTGTFGSASLDGVSDYYSQLIYKQDEDIATLFIEMNQFEKMEDINADPLKTVVAFLKSLKDATNDLESDSSTCHKSPSSPMGLPWSQNNLSNPPTPPASLPPTPPPVARQKMVNGFATAEELASKAGVMRGPDVTKGLGPRQFHMPFSPEEDLLARAMAHGPKTVDVPASLPTPPHNNQEELRGQDHCDERNSPDSFVPSSSPESVLGMEVRRYPDLSLVKQEPPDPAPSPVIPILPSCSGKGSEFRRCDVKMEPSGVFLGPEFGQPANCSQAGLVSIAITLNPAAAGNINGVVAAVADLLRVKLPNSYEASTAPDRPPAALLNIMKMQHHHRFEHRPPPLFSGAGSGQPAIMRFMRPSGPSGMFQPQVHFVPINSGSIVGKRDEQFVKGNPGSKPQWCCHCKVVVLGNGVCKSAKDLPFNKQDLHKGPERSEGNMVFCSHNCFVLYSTGMQAKATETQEATSAQLDSTPSKTFHQYSNNTSTLDVHCLPQLQPKESPAPTPPITFPPASSEMMKLESKPDELKVTVKLKSRPRAVQASVDESRPLSKRWKGMRWRKWSVQIVIPKGNLKLPCEGEITELLKRRGTSLRPEPLPKDHRKCCFCHEEGDGITDGPARLLNLDLDLWVHLNCALWSSEVYETQAGALINVELALRRGLSMKCLYCQKMGATSGCQRLRCTNIYHFTCALKAQCMFFKDKTMLCHMHRPRGGAPEHELRYFAVFRRVYVQRDEVKQIASIVQRGERDHTFRVGSLIFHAIGQLLPQQMKAFHTATAIFPVGYEASRLYWSMRYSNRRCQYMCSIDERDSQPEFIIRVVEQGHEDLVLTDTTPKGVWDKVLEPVAERRNESGTLKLFQAYLKGEDLFGLTVSAVVRIAESNFILLSLLPPHPNPYRPHTLNSTSTSKSFQSTVTGELNAPYSKQFVHSKSSQYRKMKTEWKGNVYLGRSRIQGLGLYAARDIEKHTMVIEYMGTVIRNEVANRKEKHYESQNRGVFMFRMDSEHVIDATLTGGPARNKSNLAFFHQQTAIKEPQI
ncbi:UNVERIFIED_CONTAM: hypothetical protein FKN15_071926 [Acipenser sinensis]